MLVDGVTPDMDRRLFLVQQLGKAESAFAMREDRGAFGF
jgi:hypothetical protein